MYMQEGYSRVFINQEITRIEDVLNNTQQLQQPAEDFFWSSHAYELIIQKIPALA